MLPGASKQHRPPPCPSAPCVLYVQLPPLSLLLLLLTLLLLLLLSVCDPSSILTTIVALFPNLPP
jgi:hypothetical protein